MLLTLSAGCVEHVLSYIEDLVILLLSWDGIHLYDDGFEVVLGRRPVNVQCKVNINSTKEVCE